MRIAITEQEWRTVLGVARDVGAARGGTAGEGAAVLVARIALEAIGVSIPFVVDEFDDPSPRAVSPEPEPAVVRDLRLSARTLGNVDGWCDHCRGVVAAVRLASSTGGERLCPIHGTPVRDMIEVSEGRFEPTRRPGEDHLDEVFPLAGTCGSPIGDGFCQLNPAHLGRHSPLRAEVVDTPAPRAAGGGLTADDHAPYPHEDHPGGHE